MLLLSLLLLEFVELLRLLVLLVLLDLECVMVISRSASRCCALLKLLLLAPRNVDVALLPISRGFRGIACRILRASLVVVVVFVVVFCAAAAGIVELGELAPPVVRTALPPLAILVPLLSDGSVLLVSCDLDATVLLFFVLDVVCC